MFLTHVNNIHIFSSKVYLVHSMYYIKIEINTIINFLLATRHCLKVPTSEVVFPIILGQVPSFTFVIMMNIINQGMGRKRWVSDEITSLSKCELSACQFISSATGTNKS